MTIAAGVVADVTVDAAIGDGDGLAGGASKRAGLPPRVLRPVVLGSLVLGPLVLEGRRLSQRALGLKALRTGGRGAG